MYIYIYIIMYWCMFILFGKFCDAICCWYFLVAHFCLYFFVALFCGGTFGYDYLLIAHFMVAQFVLVFGGAFVCIMGGFILAFLFEALVAICFLYCFVMFSTPKKMPPK